jgi:hypothetical protein
LTHRPTLSLSALGAVLAISTTAQASDEEEIAAGAAIVILGAADLGFSINAAIMAVNETDPIEEVAIAQTAVATPQAITGNLALGALLGDSDGDEAFAILHVPVTMTSALAAHGIWSLARPDEDTQLTFMASTMIGVNSMWTSFVIGSSVSDEDLFDDSEALVGIYEVLTTVPGIAIGVHQAVETSEFTTGWVALSAWSGVLTLHGGLYAAGLFEREPDYASNLPVSHIAFGPTTFGPAVEGAPHTPGLMLAGTLE